MTILIAILTNLLILSFLVVSVFKGKKNGLLSILKTGLTAGLIVGSYFITPLILPLLGSISFLPIDLTSSLTTASVFSITALVSFSILSLIFMIIRKSLEKKRIIKVNANKPLARKVKTKTKKDLRKERKENLRLTKTKQIIAGLFSLITALMIGYIIYLPTKMVLKDINVPHVQDVYEYTIFNQLDKLTNLDKIIIGE